MPNIVRKIRALFGADDGPIDTSECAVRIFDDPRIGKVARSSIGFTATIVEVWRKPNGDEAYVLETSTRRTYWANVNIEILSDEQVAEIGHEKCVQCGSLVADDEEWGYATEYTQALLTVGIVAVPFAILCARCAEDIVAK